MQSKHSIVWLILLVLVLVAGSACREPNPYYCSDGGQCTPPPQQCGNIKCEAPTPVCKSEAEGTCVACTMDGHCPRTNPVCDTTVNECVECRVNTDCESALCIDNSCIDPKDVAYVDEGGNDARDCSLGSACATLKRAIALNPQRAYIKASGTISDDMATAIDGKKVVIFGEPGKTIIKRSTVDEVFQIKKDADVQLTDLEILGNASIDKNCVKIEMPAGVGPLVTMTRVRVRNHGGIGAGIALIGGKLVMTDSDVVDNAGVGISASAGSVLELHHSLVARNNGPSGVLTVGASMVTIESSTIARNQGIKGGLDISANKVSITNCIIAGNGDNLTSATGGVSLSAVTSAEFAFNTVSRNQGLGLSCGVRYAVSSCIFIDNGSPVMDDVNGCDVNYSLTGITGSPLAGVNNKTGDPAFIDTMDLTSKSFFRIGPTSAAKDSADPALVITKDIDGQPRPTTNRDIGADELE